MTKGWKDFEVPARNMDMKGTSVEVSVQMRNMFLETVVKAVFVIRWQIT